jgi:pimeloyl-ACP methyl ester carboxylesterase
VSQVIVASGNAQIAYDVSGEGSSGLDVVLLHAGVTDRRSWKFVLPRLTPRHRCVAFDARQYGETTYERQDGWSGIDDTVAVMDAADVERAVLVAGSMGGATAIDVALADPGRVSGLALIGPAVHGAPYPDITEEPTASIVAKAEAAEETDDFDELNRLEAWLWLDGPTAPEGRVGGELRDLFLEMNGRALRARHPGDPRPHPDAWSRLAEIEVPTLVLVGRLDLPDMRAVDEQLAAAVPDARLVWLEGTAHLPHFEGHARCLAELADFVDQIAGARS